MSDMRPDVREALRKMIYDLVDNDGDALEAIEALGEVLRPILLTGVSEVVLRTRIFDTMRMDKKPIKAIDIGSGVTIAKRDGGWCALIIDEGERATACAKLVDGS